MEVSEILRSTAIVDMDKLLAAFLKFCVSLGLVCNLQGKMKPISVR